jgi:predicted GNAT family N-acyltransferase
MRHDYQGIGRTLLEALRAHPKLRDTKQFELYCQSDMMPYYETMGFGDISGDLVLMRKL